MAPRAGLGQPSHITTESWAIQHHTETLTNLKRTLKNVKRKEIRLRKSILDICFILFVWHAPAETLALAFAAHVARTKGCHVEVSAALLEERYLATEIETLRSIESQTGGMSKTAFAKAVRFEKEHALYTWIQTNNDKKGLAPNTNMVKQHLARQNHSGTTPSCTAGFCKQAAVSTSWVQRFRHRWALKRGSFQPGERLSQDLIGDKVRHENNLSGVPSPTLSYTGPRPPKRKRGPPGGPQTRATCLNLIVEMLHFWPPFSFIFPCCPILFVAFKCMARLQRCTHGGTTWNPCALRTSRFFVSTWMRPP